MATIPAQSATLPRAGRILLRTAAVEDAPALCALRTATSHPDAAAAAPPPSIDQPLLLSRCRDQLLSFSTHPSRLWLIALDPAGNLIAHARCFASSRPRHAHRATVSLGVVRESRGQGVGRALLEAIIHWAATHPTIEKLSLFVLRDNAAAISLYKKLGFQVEGLRKREIKLSPGRYADDLVMARFVKPPPIAPTQTSAPPSSD